MASVHPSFRDALRTRALSATNSARKKSIQHAGAMSGAGASSATLTVTAEQSPAEIVAQALQGTATLEQNTTEFNGMLVADAIMASVLTNEFVAEDLTNFCKPFAGSLPGRRCRQRGDGRGGGRVSRRISTSYSAARRSRVSRCDGSPYCAGRKGQCFCTRRDTRRTIRSAATSPCRYKGTGSSISTRRHAPRPNRPARFVR